MGKKIALLISTITVFASSVAPVAGAWADEQGWSFEEIQPFSEEVEAKRDEFCRNDSTYRDFPEMCYHQYKWDGDQTMYETASFFREMPFYITAINPSKNTVRVYYSGEDEMRKHMGMENYKYELDELGLSQRSVDDYTNCFSYINRGIEVPATCNILYHNSESESGYGWLPSGREVELKINDFVFAPETSQNVEITFETTSSSRWELVANISACVNSPEYKEGMECQARFYSFNQPKYVPVEVPEPSPVEPEDGEDEQEDREKGEGSSESESTDGQGGRGGDYTNGETIPKTPDTGVVAEECTKTINFPWWLAALLVIGDAAVIWWFIPKKTSKK